MLRRASICWRQWEKFRKPLLVFERRSLSLRHLFSLVTRSTGRKRLSINFAVNKGERRQKVRKRRALLLAPREESIVYYSGLSRSIYMYTPSPSSLLLSRYSRTSRSESGVPRFKTLHDVIPFVLRFECTYDENWENWGNFYIRPSSSLSLSPCTSARTDIKPEMLKNRSTFSETIYISIDYRPRKRFAYSIVELLLPSIRGRRDVISGYL